MASDTPDIVERLTRRAHSMASGTLFNLDGPEAAAEFNRIDRPDDVDEDGYSPSAGLSFLSVDYYVDYRISLNKEKPDVEG